MHASAIACVSQRTNDTFRRLVFSEENEKRPRSLRFTANMAAQPASETTMGTPPSSMNGDLRRFKNELRKCMNHALHASAIACVSQRVAMEHRCPVHTL